MGKLVLEIQVDIDDSVTVRGASGEATMIKFHGKCECENFKGTILPGGVDTQKQIGNEPRTLSARYVLEGYDSAGNFCHIFIENNGTMSGGDFKTKPIILTDSYALKWLETADLYGTLGMRTGGVLISIYQNHDDQFKK